MSVKALIIKSININ